LKNNRPEQVIDLFLKLDDQMDEINLLVFFNACAELGNEKGLKLGKQIYSKFLSQQIKRKEFNEKVLHAVLNMFSKCSDIDNAEKLFKQLNKNPISYGCMMTMYNNRNESDKTLALYEEMKREKIETDELIWILIINALAELSDLLTCELITSELPENFFNNIQIQNALINMWVSEEKKLFVINEYL
jgi:pentatricopeptide repeat protein